MPQEDLPNKYEIRKKQRPKEKDRLREFEQHKVHKILYTPGLIGL